MRYNILLLVSILFITSCHKQENYADIQIIGHGGMGLNHLMSIYHDNSFESIELVMQYTGVDGVEVDVQMDLDGELWLYHDIDLSSCGVEGSIPEYNTEFLEELNYQTMKKEKLCKLRDILYLFDSSKTLFIDIKAYPQSIGIVVDPIEFKNSLNNVISNEECQIGVITVNASWIAHFVNDYPTYLDSDSKSVIDNYFSLYPQLAGLFVQYETLSRDDIQHYMNQDWKIYLYNIRSVNKIRKALEKRPTGILPDDIRRAVIETE